MNEVCKIAIADDHQIVRESLCELIKKNVECSVTVLAENGLELLEKMKNRSVDIIVLDVEMPKLDGLQVLAELREKKSQVRVIILTMFDDEVLMMKLIRLKVNGFILKSDSSSELITAIREVREFGYYFSQKVSQVMATSANDEKKSMRKEEFKPSALDRSILKYLCQEKTSHEIGNLLSISNRTIENRKQRMMHHLGVRNQVGLAMYAIKKGIVSVEI